MPTHPTVVIGVGEAGSKMANHLFADLRDTHESTEDFLDDFKFIGIDTRSEDLNSTTAEYFERISLETPVDDWGRENPPYITDDMQLERSGGATRQRGVSRFYIDNSKNFDDLYTELKTGLRSFFDRNSRNAIPNVWLLNSFGGGTGSGAFPLLAAMIVQIRDDLHEEFWFGGVGSLPRLDEIEAAGGAPPADPNLYANSYAAIRELSVLLGYEFEDAEGGPDVERFQYSDQNTDRDRIEIPIYSDPDDFTKDKLVLDSCPFDFYGLMALREGKSDSYNREMNKIVANTVLYFSEVDGIEDFGRDLGTGGKPILYSLVGSGVRVPVEKLDEYVRIVSDIETVRTNQTEVCRRLNRLRVNRDILNRITDTGADETLRERTPISTSLLDPETGEKMADEPIEDPGIDIGRLWERIPKIYRKTASHAEDFPLQEYNTAADDRLENMRRSVPELPNHAEFEAEKVADYFYYTHLENRYRDRKANHAFRERVERQWDNRQTDIANKLTVNVTALEDADPLEQWEEAIEPYLKKRIKALDNAIEELPIWKRSEKKDLEKKKSRAESELVDLRDASTRYQALDEALDVVEKEAENAETALDDVKEQIEDEIDDAANRRKKHAEELTQLGNRRDTIEEILREVKGDRYITIPFDDFSEVTSELLTEAENIVELANRKVIAKSDIIRETRSLLDECDEQLMDLKPNPVGANTRDFLGALTSPGNRGILEGQFDDEVRTVNSIENAFDKFDGRDFVDLADSFSIRLAVLYSGIRLENTSEYGTIHRLYKSPERVTEQFAIDEDDDEFITNKFAYPELFPDDSDIQEYFGLTSAVADD